MIELLYQILDPAIWLEGGRIWLAIPIVLFGVLCFFFYRSPDGGQYTLPVGGERSGKSRMPKNWKQRSKQKPDDSTAPPTIWK